MKTEFATNPIINPVDVTISPLPPPYFNVEIVLWQILKIVSLWSATLIEQRARLGDEIGGRV